MRVSIDQTSSGNYTAETDQGTGADRACADRFGAFVEFPDRALVSKETKQWKF